MPLGLLTIEYNLFIAKQINQGVEHFLLLLDHDIMGLQGSHDFIARLLGMQAVAFVFGSCGNYTGFGNKLFLD